MAANNLTTSAVQAALAQIGVRPRTLLAVGPRAREWSDALAREGIRCTTDARGQADGSIDAAVLVEAFASDPPELAEVQRVLRPGGLVLTLDRPRNAKRARELVHFFDAGPPVSDHGTFRVRSATARRVAALSGHFNDIAPDYRTQIPSHVRDHYLQRKLSAFERLLPAGWHGMTGLDLGCGLGWYANAVAGRFAARVVALDASLEPLRLGRTETYGRARPRWLIGDSLRLPLRTSSLDYAYAINMLHHLKRGEQERALREVHRVLKPGAPFLVFEINTRNPVFAWYMRHVFPRTRSIDRGDEEFIHPDRLPLVPEFDVERIEYSTFAPDFVPKWALPAARALERGLERVMPRQAIHYVALLRSTKFA